MTHLSLLAARKLELAPEKCADGVRRDVEPAGQDPQIIDGQPLELFEQLAGGDHVKGRIGRV
jgi:hypothetical protein